MGNALTTFASVNTTAEESSKAKKLGIRQRGLRLDALLKISNDIKSGQLKLPNDQKFRSPGEKIVDGLVKPKTQTNQWSYSEELYHNADTAHLVGTCTAFVSHPCLLGQLSSMTRFLLLSSMRRVCQKVPHPSFILWTTLPLISTYQRTTFRNLLIW